MHRLAALAVAAAVSLPALAADPAAGELAGLRRGASLGVALGPQAAPRIDAVGPGSAAEQMGLQPGDVVVSVDGRPVADTTAFVSAIARKRAGDTLTLVVRRGETTLTRKATLAPRPLEQQADYDIEYGTVEVDGARRRTILTRPRGAGPHPAVLFIGGIGCYSLDGLLRVTVTEPYGRLLDAWTRAGYVTLRVEKSGMGDSQGVACDDPRSDFEAEARGYAAGLAALESLPSVDRDNVFVFAHSIGPLVAARITATQPVRGLVLAGTIGTSWFEYDLTNVRRQLQLSGLAYDEIEPRMRLHERCAHRFYVEQQPPRRILAAEPRCAGEIDGPAPHTYLQQVGALDLAALWKTIDAPVLIFYGTADFVTDDYQHRYLRDMINGFHPGRARYVTIEGMDHGFRLVGTQQAAIAGQPGEFAQRVVDETLRFFGSARVAAPAAAERR